MLSPRRAPWHCHTRAATCYAQQGHLSAKNHQAGRPPSPGSGAPYTPHLLKGGSLAICSGYGSGQGVPHLAPGSQLDEGTDGLVGAGPAGKHVGPVEGLEEADEVGTLRLREGRCLLLG